MAKFHRQPYKLPSTSSFSNMTSSQLLSTTTFCDLRGTPKRLIKTIFIISMLGFLLTNISFLFSGDGDDSTTDYYTEMTNESRREDLMRFLENRLQRQHLINHLKFAGIQSNSTKILLDPLNNSTNWSFPLNFDHTHHSNDPMMLIKEKIWAINRQQQIFNLDRFDLPSTGTIAIVVQVHNRPEYLQHLIDSLKRSRDIDQTLLIFSHDHYSQAINDIVLAIDFCPFMQIFYPYSQQLYKDEFPGEDPKDCPRDATRETAQKLNCLNKDTPDKYGHFREAKYTQTKHHWFWKLNHIFDYLEVTKLYEGLYLFIEEDHYLVEDFVPVLKMMDRLRSSSCSDCNLMTLGTYDKKPKYEGIHNMVDVMGWMSSKHNMGMAFNKKLWIELKKCGTAFCKMDDYNWDWSLHFIGLSCIPNKLKVMMMKAPRIFHIGECGLHAKGKNCNPSERVQFISNLVSSNSKYLYPKYVAIAGYPTQIKKVPKLNGGWGDTRDHHLCASFMEAHSHS